MSKTGTYKYVNGEMVKVSDRIPNAQVFDCHVPNKGYWSENAGHKPVFFTDRAEKRAHLKANGMAERAELTKKEW